MNVVLRDADYSFGQLRRWQYLAGRLPEVTVAGVDSRTNRLVVGLAELDAHRDGLLAELDVPSRAVTLVERRWPEVRIDPPTSRQPLLTPVATVAGLMLLAVVVPLWWHRHRRRAARAR